MIQNNCRIKTFKGYKFYEKDVLYDDYVFTQNIDITLDVLYNSPGIGIVISDAVNNLNQKPSCYLFKIGYREASIYYATVLETKLIKQISCHTATTIQEHLKFRLNKTNDKVKIYLNDKLILEYVMNKTFDKFNIGYYSNSGNIINDISIASNIPNNWIVNMKNTVGGYIDFKDSTIIITDCKDNAEIEQNNILLAAGTYYLNYKLEDINQKNDIKAYIFKSDDDRLYDVDKTLLSKTNKLIIYETGEYDLKFVGTNGKIKDIILSKDKEPDYIPTGLESVDFDGSWIDIYIKDYSLVTWYGVINAVPDDNYGIILDEENVLQPKDINLLLKKKYFYKFDCIKKHLEIYNNDKLVYIYKLLNISDKITIFKNMSAIITQLTLTKLNGEIKDVVTQDDMNIKMIPLNISSPILCLDEYETPLDLSASYRFDGEKYIFTNWEREYFKSERTIALTNKPIDNSDSIKVYGIYDATINLDAIYNINNDINDISLIANNYDYLSEQELELYDKYQGIIYLTDEQVNKYNYIIVDYLKDDSYCINIDYVNMTYQVSVSSNKETTLLYDTIKEDNIYVANKTKMTDIKVGSTGYIVLTGGK